MMIEREEGRGQAGAKDANVNGTNLLLSFSLSLIGILSL